MQVQSAICLSALDLPGPRGTEPAREFRKVRDDDDDEQRLGRGVVGRRLESGLHQKDQQTESTCPASGVACGLHAPSMASL